MRTVVSMMSGQLSHANGLGGTPTWTQVFPGGSTQTTRAAYPAVYDSVNNLMIVYGGTDNVVAYDDVWVLSHANNLGGTPTWTQIFPGGSPPGARFEHTAVYDEHNNRMIIYGGSTTFAAPPLGDVWVLSYANGTGGTPTWTQLFPAGSPPPARYSHSAVYDTTNNIMTIYGGASYDTVTHYLDDVWELSNANGLGGTPVWSQIFPSGSPPDERLGNNAVYDEGHNRMTIFGGETDGLTILNDTWVLSVANGVPVNDWMLYATESDDPHSKDP